MKITKFIEFLFCINNFFPYKRSDLTDGIVVWTYKNMFLECTVDFTMEQ